MSYLSVQRAEKMAEIKIDGHVVELSSTEKIMFPEDRLTKGDLIEYYRRISEIMLPFLKDRVISMQRFPDGIDGESFYQKEIPDFAFKTIYIIILVKFNPLLF